MTFTTVHILTYITIVQARFHCEKAKIIVKLFFIDRCLYSYYILLCSQGEKSRIGFLYFLYYMRSKCIIFLNFFLLHVYILLYKTLFLTFTLQQLYNGTYCTYTNIFIYIYIIIPFDYIFMIYFSFFFVRLQVYEQVHKLGTIIYNF